jgi:hypothetical protein
MNLTAKHTVLNSGKMSSTRLFQLRQLSIFRPSNIVILTFLYTDNYSLPTYKGGMASMDMVCI